MGRIHQDIKILLLREAPSELVGRWTAKGVLTLDPRLVFSFGPCQVLWLPCSSNRWGSIAIPAPSECRTYHILWKFQSLVAYGNR